MRSSIIPALSIVAAYLAPQVSAIWPFKQKRFTAEALIDAGPLGLDRVNGRVVAIGDWDGDRHSDLFVLSEDRKNVQVFLWNRDTFAFLPSHNLTVSEAIANLVPGDFDHDGRLDLLVMYEQGDGGWWGAKANQLGMTVFFGGGKDGDFRPDSWALPPSTTSQAIVFDVDGSLRPSLLAIPADDEDEGFKVWQNNGTGMSMSIPPFTSPSSACKLGDPHSSAFIDLDGDCSPDLVLHCGDSYGSQQSIQIWLNRGSSGYILHSTLELPDGSGALSFADMDRDGTMDIVFPTCDRTYSSSGVGYDCAINIAYNKQAPICSGESSIYSSTTDTNSLKCRGWGSLCEADPNFEFTFEEGNEWFQSIPLVSILPSASDLLLHAAEPSIPIAIRPGDYNVDGFPDLLIVAHNATAIPGSGGILGSPASPGNQARVLQNVACGKGVAGCDGKGKGRRGLRSWSGKGWEVLDEIWDVQSAAWVDLDDDGSLDILLQRSGKQNGDRVTFIQNNFYHDAFFLKAQVLNGACDGECVPTDGGKEYGGVGVNYPGATFKFTVLDTLGHRVAQQVAQVPQTSYHALNSPYSFIGLGRTNNYVERLFVGTSLNPPLHVSNLESLIPNSQVVINPPAPAWLEGDTAPQPVKTRSQEWRSELFLHPGDWIPWVGTAVFGTVIVLGMVVAGLHEQEKREDEKERRRALHAINFHAL